MATLVILEVRAKEGALPEVKEFLAKNLPDTRGYDGCLELTPYLNEDGRTVVIVEKWVSKPQYEQYLAWRQETGALADFGKLTEGEPNIRYFEAIDA